MTKSPFLQSVESFMIARRYSRRTISTYLYWMKYFIVFNNKQHPSDLGNVDIERFLTFLALSVMPLWQHRCLHLIPLFL